MLHMKPGATKFFPPKFSAANSDSNYFSVYQSSTGDRVFLEFLTDA